MAVLGFSGSCSQITRSLSCGMELLRRYTRWPINLANDSQKTFIAGLSSAIDVLPVRRLGQDQFYTLEFSADMLANASGRLQFFSSTSAAPVVIADKLISPTSRVR